MEGSPLTAWTALERSVVAEAVNLDDKSGWTYLRAMPGSRQRRKRLMTMFVLGPRQVPGSNLS